jgi:ubiquinone/menaquinone biosynthesis C-methylase UbiE
MYRFDTIEDYDREIPHHLMRYYLIKKGNKILIELDFLNKRNMKGIDLGCGTGEHINFLVNRKNDINRIDGVDISIKQINLAKRKYKHINYICGSITDIPIKDDTYNFAYCINAMHHLATKEEQVNVLKEVYRILKKDGIFILHEMNVKNPLIHYYLNYIFPLTKNIDEGKEIWVGKQIIIDSHFELIKIDYFTFTPDFAPKISLKLFQFIDSILEKTIFAKYGAHIMFVLKKL